MKKVLLFLVVFILAILLLFSFDIIWKSPSFYSVKNSKKLESPIMNMTDYEKIWETHRRPYVYSIKSEYGGEVTIVGVEHISDPNHAQFDTIKKYWNEKTPTVALVEGRMGFMFTWFMNPIENYGESGLVSSLAKENNIDLYTWEPTKEDEVEILINQYSADKLAMFYSFRPYFSNMRHGKPNNPEEKLEEYLNSRTDTKHLKNVYNSWEELDSIWKNDFPDIEWRNYSDGNGWPKGYLHDIWNSSNQTRDEHLVQSIIEFVQRGENVFVTVGVSHAPRIEKTLIKALE